MLTVVDYNMGNVQSIARALEALTDAELCVSGSPRDIRAAEALILPGVGAFDAGLKELKRLNLMKALHEAVHERGCPFLGVCLGMQLLAESSQEGRTSGLGWIKGRVERFDFPESAKQRIPHVGWNRLNFQYDHALCQKLSENNRFYFTHSYHFVPDNKADILATTEYGVLFVSMVQKDNIFGVQCHPEISHDDGRTMLKNFIQLSGMKTSHHNDPSKMKGRYGTRIFPSLLIRGEGLIKTTKFRDPRYIGDPINAVKIFNTKHVDEMLVMDIYATPEKRPPAFDLIGRISQECSMPLSYGGGIRSMDDVRRLIGLGVEKVAIGSQAVVDARILSEVAAQCGRQAVIAVMDVRKKWLGGYEVLIENGRRPTTWDPVRLAKEWEQSGVGEILVNSIDRDGTMSGYDLTLLKMIADHVQVPVIASGGCSSLDNMKQAVEQSGVSALTAGSLFVYHGRRRAVLINFPDRQQLEDVFSDEVQHAKT